MDPSKDRVLRPSALQRVPAPAWQAAQLEWRISRSCEQYISLLKKRLDDRVPDRLSLLLRLATARPHSSDNVTIAGQKSPGCCHNLIMDTGTILGLTAGTLTTMSLLPQMIKTWRSKSAKDISLGMFATLCAGLLLWIAYGFYINSSPVIITNIVSFVVAFVIMLLKIKFG